MLLFICAEPLNLERAITEQELVDMDSGQSFPKTMNSLNAYFG